MVKDRACLQGIPKAIGEYSDLYDSIRNNLSRIDVLENQLEQEKKNQDIRAKRFKDCQVKIAGVPLDEKTMNDIENMYEIICKEGEKKIAQDINLKYRR